MVAVAPATLDATRYSLSVRRLSLARSLLLLPLLSSGMACLPGAADGAQAGVTSAPPAQATAPLAPAPPAPPPPAPVTALPPTPQPTAVPPTPTPLNLPLPAGVPEAPEDPADGRTIAGLRARAYEAGPLEVLRTLSSTPQYTSYAIAYVSDGLRITGYLNVPRGEGPFPVLLINHGYVPPTGYIAVVSNYTKREGDYFATRGYLTAGSDYRGHGNNPGTAAGGHLEPAYVVDALNLLATLKQHPQADPQRIGVWGHSMGGSIAERMMVVSKDVDATVIWAGVSADAGDAWRYGLRHRPERELRERYGHPDDDPGLYRRMSSRAYLADIAGPVQIHHGTADESVPYAHGAELALRLAGAGKAHELFTYSGAPHNWFGATWNTALGRSLAFFDAHVKAGV
jgi:dipeptidyl aminopeptidase/acylaminoacyl peptidase